MNSALLQRSRRLEWAEIEAEFGRLTAQAAFVALSHLLGVFGEPGFDIFDTVSHDLPIKDREFPGGGHDGHGGATPPADAAVELPERAVFGFRQAHSCFSKDLRDFGFAPGHPA